MLQETNLLGVVFLTEQTAQKVDVGGALVDGSGEAFVQDLSDPA